MIRSAARPSQSVGASRPRRNGAEATAAATSAGSGASTFVPHAMDSPHSVLVRTVTQGTPSAVDSTWIPPANC